MTDVTAGLNYTRNLGNFENVKVNVEVTDSVREGENVAQAFDRVYGFVERKFLEKVDEIEKELEALRG